MYLRDLSLLTIFLFSSLSFGQFSSTLIGKEYNTSKRENFSGFIGETSTALYTADYIYYNKRKHELIIKQFYQGDLSLVNSHNLYSIIDENYTNDPQELFFCQEQFYLFSKMQSVRDKTELLALEIFDINCERLNYVILDTLASDEVQYISESNSKNGFIVAKHLRYTQLVEQEIELLKIDMRGEIAFQKTIRSPMALQSLRIENILFGENTPLYILCNYAYNIKTAEEQDNSLVNNKYALWVYDAQNNFLKEFELRLKNKWVNGIKLALNNKTHLIISGYFNETKNSAINGIFSLKINSQLQLIKTSWQKFEPTTLSKFDKRDSKKKLKELEDFKLNHILMLDDNSFFLTGEKFYKYIERNYDPRTNITTNTEHYNYNSIICSYFDAQGNHIWTDRIPKYQNTTNDYGRNSSYTVLNSGKDIFLFFNDTQKNNEVNLGDYDNYTNMFNNRRFQITYVQMNKKGVQKRTNLLSNTNDFMLRAKLSEQLSKKGIYLMTETNRSNKIIKISAPI